MSTIQRIVYSNEQFYLLDGFTELWKKEKINKFQFYCQSKSLKNELADPSIEQVIYNAKRKLIIIKHSTQ